MSYIEHGSRIFSAVNNALSWSRSDGRLKEYDSCSDIRAWSPNELENSRYFRELTETASSPANKVIPFSVVIDNLIELGTQTENELSNVRRELERYKSLDLSLEQATQLRNAELNDEQDDPTPFFLHSLSGTKSLSKCSVIKNDRATSPDLHICDSENTVDPPISIENSNIGIQVCPEHVPDTEQNVKESVNRSSICDFIDVSTEEILNYESRPRRSRSRGSISSCNETSTFGSEIDKSSVSSEDLTDITQGKLIIEKDSMIISLKIDLKAKEMEIAELQSENKILQSRIHGMGTKMNFLQGNLKLSQEKLAGMGDLQCCELKDLKYELDHNRNEIKVLQKCIIEQKQELNALIQKEQTVRKERDALASQVDEMAKSVEDFDKVSKALDELKNIQRERDELLEEKKRLCDYLNDDNQIIYDLVHMCNNMARKSEKTKRSEHSLQPVVRIPKHVSTERLVHCKAVKP